jgi:hypothetical protein
MFEDAPSSFHFSVLLTRESSKSKLINPKDLSIGKNGITSQVRELVAASVVEATAAFQPRPPPARFLNQSPPAKGNLSSSPKQKFSVSGKHLSRESFHGDGFEPQIMLASQNSAPGDSTSLQLILETFSEQIDPGLSNMVSTQKGYSDGLLSNGTVSVKAVDLVSMQQLIMEVKAMDSWLRAKASNLL